MKVRSPFHVVENFLSPLACEEIVPCVSDFQVDVVDGKPTKTVRTEIDFQTDVESVLMETLLNSAIPLLEAHYGVEYRSLLPFEYHHYPQDFMGDKELICDNAVYLNGSWLRNRDIDFTSILFLNDFNDNTPFDPRYEVTGGKIEMISYNFSFQPQRGTLVTFPGCPRHLHRVSNVTLGESNFIKMFWNTTVPYVHDPSKFPGTFEEWFE